MKLNTKHFLLFGLPLLFTAQSCNKYLDQEPDNRTQINSVSKVAQLVATAYPQYDYYTFTEAASDNAEDKGNGVGTTADVSTLPYFWKDVVGAGTGTSTNYWNGCYSGIAAANQALESIQQNDFGNAVLPYKGEALVARAYAHFMLVTFFAKEYTIGGANDSPGIPYVTVPETKVIQQYDRGTVKSTYEQIEKDLTEGIALLSASAYSVPKYHFTPAAAHAFAARFYLFKGEYQKVIDHANAVVAGGDYTGQVRPFNSSLAAMSTADYQAALTKSDQKHILLLANQYSAYQRLTSPRYGYGQNLVKMFAAGGSSGNITGKAYQNKILSYGVPNYTAYKYREYFYVTDQVANIGFPYIMAPLLITDEALLNRGEAYAKLGQYENALKDANLILANTVANYNPAADAATQAKVATFYGVADPKEGIVKLILDIKKAQFLQEGMRWMDILRNHLPVKHNIYDANGVETFVTLEAGDNRRVFQIPEEAKLSGVPLNPR
ncbi:RagB/SusD family nutrient uptake outer membrane protein [Pedobacter frigiditerrae]|uniref:RagB/SusD family nutrient uptake outer membrane protein n=1 Tax=Pedobacter frigiditerrae TaxID=2530452 RepID=UPI00293167E8|nr:RagB/SusD family nutrient uptake outer membrane protein [Pedobacter frigiditerrae]